MYYNFESRDALVEEVLWFGMDSLRRRVSDAVTAQDRTADGLELLRIATDAHLRLELDIADYAQAAIRNAGHVAPGIRRRNADELVAYRDLWRDLVARGNADGSLPVRDRQDLTLRFALGALNWTAEWWSSERGRVDDLVRTATIVIEHGLAGPAFGVPPRQEPATAPVEERSTRDRILASAARVLKDRGYATTYLADIAELAGVQAPALYHYYRSREELLQRVMTEGNRAVLEHVQSRLTALPAGVTTRDQLAAVVAAHLEMELELSDFAAAVIRNAGQAPEAVRSAVALEAGAYQDVWRLLLAQAAAAHELREGIEPRMARMLVHGALNWATEWWNPNIPVGEMVAAAQALVINGLLTG
jgi:AcrR family transcriptional regulator